MQAQSTARAYNGTGCVILTDCIREAGVIARITSDMVKVHITRVCRYPQGAEGVKFPHQKTWVAWRFTRKTPEMESSPRNTRSKGPHNKDNPMEIPSGIKNSKLEQDGNLRRTSLVSRLKTLVWHQLLVLN
jgi:hypothetical protein